MVAAVVVAAVVLVAIVVVVAAVVVVASCWLMRAISSWMRAFCVAVLVLVVVAALFWGGEMNVRVLQAWTATDSKVLTSSELDSEDERATLLGAIAI